MATGRAAFSGTTSAAIFDGILHGAPVAPVHLNPQAPLELGRIINKALEKDRELRYQTASELRGDLKRLKRETDFGRRAVLPADTGEIARGGSSGSAHGSAASGLAGAASGAVSAQRWPRIFAIAATMIVLAGMATGGWYWRSWQMQHLGARDNIVLGDFANSTGDVVFDDTLKQALSMTLRQSPFLNILPDDEVATTLKEMTRPSDTPLTPAVAREVCQRSGSKVYIAGAVASLGSDYVLSLKAVNCRTGKGKSAGRARCVGEPFAQRFGRIAGHRSKVRHFAGAGDDVIA
jgi:hypothetical protein